MSDEIEIDTDDLERRMDGAIASLRNDFASLRTGRASASMLDPVSIDAYGADTPINQVGTINVPEPRMSTLATLPMAASAWRRTGATMPPRFRAGASNK